jgi:hypothetical protein
MTYDNAKKLIGKRVIYDDGRTSIGSFIVLKVKQCKITSEVFSVSELYTSVPARYCSVLEEP